jgi:hypothetical protein
MTSPRRRRWNRRHHRRHRYRRHRSERSTSTTSDTPTNARHSDDTDSAVIDEFQVRTTATFGPEFNAELDRLIEAAHEHIIDEEYSDKQWGPRMEHELRTAIRRMVVMNAPAKEIYHTLSIAEFGEPSRQHQQDRDHAERIESSGDGS